MFLKIGIVILHYIIARAFCQVCMCKNHPDIMVFFDVFHKKITKNPPLECDNLTIFSSASKRALTNPRNDTIIPSLARPPSREHLSSPPAESRANLPARHGEYVFFDGASERLPPPHRPFGSQVWPCLLPASDQQSFPSLLKGRLSI